MTRDEIVAILRETWAAQGGTLADLWERQADEILAAHANASAFQASTKNANAKPSGTRRTRGTTAPAVSAKKHNTAAM